VFKQFLQRRFDEWVARAYREPDGAWRQRLARWYMAGGETPAQRYLQRRLKNAISHCAQLPARDLGWQKLGFDDIEIRASSDNILTAPLFFGARGQSLFELYRRFARPGSTALDVGTNNGAHALVMARCVGPQGRVFGFEPTPRMHEQAEANCAHNGAAQVQVQVAVGDQPGEARFDDASDQPNTGISRITETGSRRVEVVTLDQCVPTELDVSLIKIDVEGHELAVLRGAQALLARTRPAIVLEFNIGSYDWNSLLAAIPYPVEVFHIPPRPGQPLRPLAGEAEALRINRRHMDLLLQPR
jgi:FkbM family methyltransferase